MNISILVPTAISIPAPAAAGGAAPAAAPAPAPAPGDGAWLPPPPGGGDSLSEIMALLTDELRQDRSQARDARRNAHEAAQRAGRARVADLHRAADDRYDAAFTSGLATVGGGVLGAAAGGVGLAGIDAGSGSVGAGHEQWATMLSASGKGVGGIGELLAAGDAADADHAEAAAAAHDLEARGHSHAREEHGERLEEAQRLLRRVSELEGEIREGKVQAERAAVYLRG
ncbi:MAG: hypothetical protein IT376_00520 [Polyangiaceae bacterium]|nr:hypothetical protein [Polyangiaceae bacterium]